MISISVKHWEELLDQLEYLIQLRIKQSNTSSNINNRQLLKPIENIHAEFISDSVGIKLSKEEELICSIALLLHSIPGYFDAVVSRIYPEGAELQELGGVKGMSHRGFIPTGETALFLLAGNDIYLRMRAMQLFNSDRPLTKHNILHIENI